MANVEFVLVINDIKFIAGAPIKGVLEHPFPRTLLEVDPVPRHVGTLEGLRASLRMRHHG